MTWSDLHPQPVSLLLRQRTFLPDEWLQLIQERQFMSWPKIGLAARHLPATLTPEECLGRLFAPDAPVDWEVLQTAGLLLKNGQIRVEPAFFAARKSGGGLYFKWFLAQLGLVAENPLPHKKFPLHPSRWNKRRWHPGSGSP